MIAQTVSNNIAGLTVSGVTLKAWAAANDGVETSLCPVLIPRPDNFITGYTSEPMSCGVAGSAVKLAKYALNYLFFYAPAGSEDSVKTLQSGAETKLELLITAIEAADTTLGVTWINVTSEAWGIYQDAATAQTFYGCAVAVNVEQYLNL